jgi:hypothetical protein
VPVHPPYSREFFAPRPSTWVLFFRTFVLWQIVRFIAVNIKMLRMIGKAHSHRALPPASASPGSGRLAASAAH